MILPMRATTRQQEETDKTWTKEKTLEQTMKRSTEEGALTESRALP
jgi:hypothetical protein